MLTKFLTFACIVFLIFIAGCGSGSESSDSGYGTDDAVVSLGQFELIDYVDGNEIGGCCGPRETNIGADNEGNVIAVMWKNWEIFANRYVVGSGWGIPEKLDTIEYSHFPVIAVADNGNALAAWIHAPTSSTTYYFTSYYDRDLGWGEPVKLNNDNGEFSRYMSISVDAEENYIMVWEQIGGEVDFETGAIWSKKFSPISGWEAEEIISTGTGYTVMPTVKLNSTSHGFAIWMQKKGVPEIDTLNAARYNPISGWDTPVELDLISSGSHIIFSELEGRQFVVDEDGEALFVFMQDRDDSVFTYEDDIFTSQYTNGFGWGTAELLEINSPGKGSIPLIGISGDGTALLVWFEGTSSNPQSWYRLYNTSTGWTPSKQIGDMIIDNLSVNEQGNAVVQWSSYEGGKTRIFIRRYTMHGNWTTSEEIDVGDIKIALGVKVILDNQNMITITCEGYAARVPF
jgi:hypothetical protein